MSDEPLDLDALSARPVLSPDYFTTTDRFGEGDKDDLIAELRAHRGRVAAVRALHVIDGPSGYDMGCQTCWTIGPCATIRALDGEGDER